MSFSRLPTRGRRVPPGVLYPNEAIVRNAIRGCATYQLAGSMRTSGRMQNITACRKLSQKTYSTTACMAPSDEPVRQ